MEPRTARVCVRVAQAVAGGSFSTTLPTGLGAQVDGDALREGVVGALPVAARVAVDGVARDVVLRVARRGHRLALRQVAAARERRWAAGGGRVGGRRGDGAAGPAG